MERTGTRPTVVTEESRTWYRLPPAEQFPVKALIDAMGWREAGAEYWETTGRGIGGPWFAPLVHADAAAVNVNFWVTPDEANLSPESGGLVVYKEEAPLDWRFTAYNADQGRIRQFLAQRDSGKMVVPHRQNRVVLFNSDLFHETDRFTFKPGYENRRINVTMLFGRRQDG